VSFKGKSRVAQAVGVECSVLGAQRLLSATCMLSCGPLTDGVQSSILQNTLKRIIFLIISYKTNNLN